MWTRKVSPQRDAAPTMHHSGDGVRQVMNGTWFSPDMTLGVQNQTVLFWFHQTRQFCFSRSENSKLAAVRLLVGSGFHKDLIGGVR